MIESAVYPHCVAASSPAGSTASSRRDSTRLEESGPLKDQKAEGIVDAREEVIASTELATEQVDARADTLDAQSDILPAPLSDDIPGQVLSCAEEKDVGGKEASEDSVAKHDDTLEQESSEDLTATADHETAMQITSPDALHTEHQNDPILELSEKESATTTPSSVPTHPIASTSTITEIQPFREDLIGFIDNADLKQSVAKTPSSSPVPPIASKSTITEVQPMQEDLIVEPIDNADLTDEPYACVIHEPSEMTVPSRSVLEAASPLLSPSVLTLTYEVDTIAEAEQSVACERAIVAEQAEDSAVQQDPAIGDALIDSATSMFRLLFDPRYDRLTHTRSALSPAHLPVRSREETTAVTSEENNVTTTPSHSGVDEAGSFQLPTNEEDKHIDQTATPDDQINPSHSSRLSASIRPRSSAEPEYEEPESAVLKTVATERQDIKGEDSSSASEQKAPQTSNLPGNEPQAGFPRRLQPEVRDIMSKTPTQSVLEPLANAAGRALKRRATSAMFEEPKRRKVVHDTRLESTRPQRFPSGHTLKGIGGSSGKLKTGRTFSMPIPEDSVFFNAANANTAGPFPPKMDLRMPSSPESVTGVATPPPGSNSSEQTDSHQTSLLQDDASLAGFSGNQREDDVGKNENLWNARDNQPSELNERGSLREMDKEAVVALGAEGEKGSLERDGELQSHRPGVAWQPPM